MRGTNEMLASKQDIAKCQTKALWDHRVDSSQFVCLLLGLYVFIIIIRSETFTYILMIQTLSAVMQLFKGSYFSVASASRHFWQNSAIMNGTTHVFHNLWVLFHLLQDHIFFNVFKWNINNWFCKSTMVKWRRDESTTKQSNFQNWKKLVDKIIRHCFIE